MSKVSLMDAQAAVARAAKAGAALKPGHDLAVLIAVEFTGQRRRLSAAAKLARNAAAATKTEASAGAAGDLDFDASLAEFEELARSAGAEIAATLVQRRPKPDAATLVGQGKVEEIEAVAASTGADVVLSTTI